MARGFESKSVQEQWQDAEAALEMRKKPKKSAEQIEIEKKREGLEMSRRRIARELETTTSERRREQLRAALAHLDGELKKRGA
jgi:DNA-binding transcriptional regulator YiaG